MSNERKGEAGRLAPWTGALEGAGLSDEERKAKLAEIRAGLRYKNCSAWQKAQIAAEEAAAEEAGIDTSAAPNAASLDAARAAALEATIASERAPAAGQRA